MYELSQRVQRAKHSRSNACGGLAALLVLLPPPPLTAGFYYHILSGLRVKKHAQTVCWFRPKDLSFTGCTDTRKVWVPPQQSGVHVS